MTRDLDLYDGHYGQTVAMERHTGAACVGIDINPRATEAAKERVGRGGGRPPRLVPGGRRRRPAAVP